MMPSKVRILVLCCAMFGLSGLLTARATAQSDWDIGGSFIKGYEAARQAALQRQQLAMQQKYLDEQLRLQRQAMALEQARLAHEQMATDEQRQSAEEHRRALAALSGQNLEPAKDFVIAVPMNRMLPDIVVVKPEPLPEPVGTGLSRTNNIAAAISSMTRITSPASSSKKLDSAKQ